MTSPRRKRIKWERWCKRCMTWASMNADIWRHRKRNYLIDGRALAQKKWHVQSAIRSLNCTVMRPPRHISTKWNKPVRFYEAPAGFIEKLDLIAALIEKLTEEGRRV